MVLGFADIGLIIGLIVVSFISGAISLIVLNWIADKKVRSMEKQFYGNKGVVARREQDSQNEQEMILAITEALELHSQGKQVPEIIKEIGLKHPAVAMSFIKQFLSGKIKLPAGMGGFLK